MDLNVETAFRSAIKTTLSQNAVNVTFTKKDGSERVMKCTTKPDYTPSEKQPKNAGYEHTDEVQRVYDLEKGEWRSFRWDNVKLINVLLEENV